MKTPKLSLAICNTPSITAGTGVIEGALEIASESLEGFMRS